MHSCLFYAYMFSADFCRGGKQNQNGPIAYVQLVELHANCTHANCTQALTDKSAKMPSQNVDIDTDLYGNHVKLQVAFQAKLTHLKTAQF